MSYRKKDEDADQAIVKVDRTSVYQEGTASTPSTVVSLTNMHIKRGSSIHLPYHLEDVESYSPRLDSSSSPESGSLQTKLPLSSSAYPSCSKTKIPRYGKWYT